MNNKVMISVLMTVYNAERFVYEAIESILNQTYQDFEFIIVDNCSTDRSPEIIRSFKDPRIRCILNQENLGQTKALNIGIAHAQGEYIARMDADDVSFPNRLQAQFDFMEQNPSIDVLGSWCLDINKNGQSVRQRSRPPTDPLTIKCFMIGSGELTTWCLAHPTVMMRKSSLLKVGGYNEAKSHIPGYPQDYDLWTRMIYAGCRFANIPEILLKYRILESSESRGFVDKTLKERCNITVERIKSYMPQISLDDQTALVNMLEFLPQEAQATDAKIFNLFDSFFERYMATEKENLSFSQFKAKIKLYYIPQLFVTHKWIAIKSFFNIMFLNPSLMFDVRVYRKIAKSLLKF